MSQRRVRVPARAVAFERWDAPRGGRVARALVALTRAYQRVVSPLMGMRCRFHPSCSEYFAQSLECHGAARGLALGARRLLRCHPWNPGGFDPVPSAKRDVGVAA